MLSNLKIENVAVIEKSDISFENGLNIMTGETGAGKSIVIDAINAILGARTSKDIVRSGTAAAKVSAYFENISRQAVEILNELEIEVESDGSLLVTRSITSDGRTACRINGQVVTVSMLKQLGRELITICGQHDSQYLLQKETHIGYIDYLACLEDDLAQYRSIFYELKEKLKELNKLRDNSAENLQKLEYLKFQMNEIESADIKIGERDTLVAEKKRIENRERIAKALYGVEMVINGDENNSGINEGLYSLSNLLEELSEYNDSFDEYRKKLDDFRFELEDCLSLVSKENGSFDNEYSDLNSVEERLDTIYRLSKKYGGSEEAIIEHFNKISIEIKSIENFDELEEKLENELYDLNERLIEKGEYISAQRKRFASVFEQNVRTELAYLDMPSAEFTVSFERTKPSVNGLEDVEFLFSANSGQSPKPLSKIASGGELSRTMLAIKCVLSDAETTSSMIFDEIDTGVSGRAAHKIAYKLKQLSAKKQIICVTHLAQIAAAADNHLLIEKNSTENNTYTEVRKLIDDERISEVARIIGGDVITKTTLLSACELIDFANTP